MIIIEMVEKRKYKILIVAYQASLLQILPFVKYLKKENPSAVIHLLTNMKMDSVTCQIKEYVSKTFFIREISGKYEYTSLGKRINKCLLLFSFFCLSFRKYDIVNIHFARPALLKAMPWIKRMSKNVVITPWGSDVLRLEDNNAINRMRKIYSYACCVTCRPASQLGKAVAEKFGYDLQKMCPLGFGMDFVDYLEEKQPNKTVEESKARFGIDGRYVITCGYSTAPSHRHEAIIDAVNSIKDGLPKNLTLLFPFTYGWGTPQYIQSIKDKCLGYGIDAIYVEEFLNMEDLYTLRMATDMFVHVQTTDAGAASVIQYILCHKKIVHGSWMKYGWEKHKPLFYYPVDDLKDLGGVILEAYRSEGIDVSDELLRAFMQSGWNNMIKKWDGLFSSMVD